MKISIDARSLVAPITGTGVALLETIRELRALKSKDEYLLLTSRGIDPRAVETGALILQAPPLFRRAGSLFFRYGLKKLLEESEAQIHWATLQVGPRRRPKKTRILLQMHDLVFRRFPETMSRRNALISNLWVKKSLSEADLVYCVSEHTRGEILDWLGADEDRVRTIPNGVSSRFALGPPEFNAADFRKRHGLPERYLLFVGTLEPRKNLGTLLDALPLVKAMTGEDVKLVVIGGRGWRNESLRRQLGRAVASGRVVTPGYVHPAELPGFFAAAEFLIFPSLYEGFGLPLLEAMAAGTPVLSSRTSAMPEVGGTVAEYFDPTNVEEIAYSIDQLLGDPAKQADMAARGRARAREFSWERTARSVRALFEELA